MQRNRTNTLAGLLTVLAFGPAGAQARDREAGYADMLAALRAEVVAALPKVDENKKAALRRAREAVKQAEAEATAAQQALGKVQTAKALVDHAKGKWIGGAEKGLAQAEAALKKAATEAEREAARKERAKWTANKDDGLKALAERQAAYDQVRRDEPRLKEAAGKAQAALDRARAQEIEAAAALLSDAAPFLAADGLDAKLAKGAVLAQATPRGLADFAGQGEGQAALVETLLADPLLMKEMLVAGGAEAGRYGPAMQIYTALRKANPRAQGGLFQRLALAVALEHAVPVSLTDGTAVADPLERYRHYEKAWLDGELDPAFKDFSAWEYRMVVDVDAAEPILAWGREMLRNYRPDHIHNPDYGWRYSGAVRTDVRYGSQDVKNDVPTLHKYQNILKNGGVCGRRAFFGRYILKSFGIPTWGVTQHKHAAVGRWTPKGWVVNLGAGFQHSWWDKDGAARSGSDFLLETQARAVPQEYLKVLRARWAGLVLGEPAYNDRKRVEGGFWSNLAHEQARAIAAAAKAVALDPVGQELAEANESPEAGPAAPTTVAEEDRTAVAGPGGAIVIPAAGFAGRPSRVSVMKSGLGGMQAHVGGGFKAEYEVEVPRDGRYALVARVVTVQEGQRILVRAAKESGEIAVPYTCGLWKSTPPVVLSLVGGKNVLHVAVQDGSRGVTIKDFTLTPMP